MLGLGILAAIPGYRFGFKAKPALATTVSLIGQSFLVFLIVGESMRSVLQGALGVALALIYVMNIAGTISAAIGRRRLPPVVVRKSMWTAAGLLLVIMLCFHHFSLLAMTFNLWILVLPPILHGILADPEWAGFTGREEPLRERG